LTALSNLVSCKLELISYRQIQSYTWNWTL